MASSGSRRTKKDAYLPMDAPFGHYIYFSLHSGLDATLSALCLYLTCGYILEFASQRGKLLGFSYVEYMLCSLWFPLLTGFWYAKYVFGSNVSIEESVLLEVLHDVHNRSINGGVMKWRHIAHRANKLTRDMGRSIPVFYSGDQCMKYFTMRVVPAVEKGQSLFRKAPRDSVEAHNRFSEEVVRKYRMRVASMYAVDVASIYGVETGSG